VIYLDATALRSFSDCREFYRQNQLVNITSATPSIHYELGRAVHLAVEKFWAGEPVEVAIAAAYSIAEQYPVKLLPAHELEKWKGLVEIIPDVVSVYYDSVEYSPESLIWTEEEWSLPYNEEVTLCGRLDRLMVGPRLVDVKTASEINMNGIPWKTSFREEKLLDLQFQLYDYWLRKTGKAPIECYLEVILKPYRGKPARFERIDLPEVLTDGYRQRFEQQLAWKVSEITHYIKNYSSQKPWPMAGGLACKNRYGTCMYQPICVWGEIPKVMEKYTAREEHLLVRGAKS
jgi:PD-(D/E)XK nuclease superfamily